MDLLISIIHGMSLVCLALTAVALLLKAILVFIKRGFDTAAYIISFFRIYGPAERKTVSSKSWRRYMRYNNMLNYFIYFTILLFLIMLLIYQKDVFTLN